MDKAQKIMQEQKLQQRLTPLQVQFVRMLEMSGPEVEEEVRRALDDMPALETAERQEQSVDTSTEDGQPFTETADEIQLADYNSDDDIPDYLASRSYSNESGEFRYDGRNHSADDNYFEPVVVANSESLIESLNSQIAEQEISPEEELIARYIIGNIDDNGYLARDLNAIADDIAIAEGTDFTTDQMKAVWQRVRQLDPPGVGAIDLRDCLILQLQRLQKSAETLTALEIIRNYFDLFSKKHFDRIRSSLGITREQFKDALDTISRLNPKPGSHYESTGMEASSHHIYPDFLVEADNDGNLTLSLLNRIPELQIEKTFAEDTPLPEANERQRADARIFIRQKREDAANFIKILRMRQQTLYSVMAAIMKLQRDFFLTEDETRIRPMILRDVAALTGQDLSVISRATQGKYVMTRHGLYPLKMFFNERRQNNRRDNPAVITVATADTTSDTSRPNDTNSTHSLMASIRNIISSEDKHHPLSDEQITAMLQQSGYDIARRTVAKYREKLGLPVARLRKEL